MPDATPQDELIFEAALKIAGDAERRAYLAKACASDPALLARLQALLGEQSAAERFFDEGAAALDEPTVLGRPLNERVGERVGRYRLREKVGEGGCGAVYVAEQEQPVRRRVALKVIKLGMDTRNVVARFDAERQALAMMDHPNIARVLDAGATKGGRPFFVMELVRGVRITEYCQDYELSTSQRLELFIQVCRAVQHAHQKGIIHRDLKPSNILVTLHDGVPVPKVIDFGIAKATEGRLTELTVYTELHQFVGTPTYMSPEQAQLSGLDIDTRTDIYSLGVVLYELLTGTPPFDPKELLSAGLEQMRRTICEREPVRPSTRLKHETARGGAGGDRRGATPPKCRIDPDLDWIVMKCLEKDRRRRYETANGLARELERYLQHEPIVARPPSVLYRTGKALRRHRLAFSVAGVIGVVCLLAAAISSWQALRAWRAEQHQADLRQQAENAQNNEATQRGLAEQRLYDSLVGEAHATRLARRVGYRSVAFKLLQQAQALDVPRKDLTQLRREAAACLGDFMGMSSRSLARSARTTQRLDMSVSPDSRMLALPEEDGRIRLFELPSGAPIGTLQGQAPAWGVTFDGNSRDLVTVQARAAGEDSFNPESSVLQIWTRGSDDIWHPSEPVPVPGACQLLTTKVGTYLTIGTPHSVRIVNARSQALLHEVEGDRQVALSPAARWLVIGNDDPTSQPSPSLGVWDLQTGQWVRRSLETGLPGLVSMSFSPDGKYLLCIGGSAALIYDAAKWERVTRWNDYFGVNPRVAFSPASSLLALPLPQQNRVRLWQPGRNDDFAVLEEPQAIFHTAFTPDGSLLLTAGDHEVRLYSMDATPEKLILAGHTASCPEVAFSPTGPHLASIGRDHVLRMWNSVTGELEWAKDTTPWLGECVCYTPDGRWLATAYFNTGLIHLWDARTGARLQEFGKKAQDNVWSAQFVGNGEDLMLANSGTPDPGIHFWHVGSSLGSSDTNEPSLFKTVAFSPMRVVITAPDGHHFAFAKGRNYELGDLYVWDSHQSTPPRLLMENIEENVQLGSFTPDSRNFLVLDSNRCVVTLQIDTAEKRASFPTVAAGEPWSVTMKMRLSPDGSKLALSSASGLGADVWAVPSGRLLYSLPEEAGAVSWLEWNGDNQKLAVARTTGQIGIWDLPAVERILGSIGLVLPPALGAAP
jgi:serine/threonine protein kinase/WD40 repeat protein